MKRLPTTQQITWFLDLNRNKQLDLNPPYQRKSVWSPKDRRFFMDTIFRNYPTPPIFMHRTIDENGFVTYHVVDGKQRLETILSFANNKIGIDQSFGNEDLNGKKFNELTIEQKRIFWDYTLVVDFLEIVEGKSIDEVFDRVNRNSRNLQPQELRHARYNGWLINEIESENDDDFWWDLKINTRAKDKRMRNEQFISELLAICLTKQITGFSQEFLDDLYTLYDSPEETVPGFDEEDYKESKSFVKNYLRQMDQHNKCIVQFGKGAIHFYSLWSLIAIHSESLPAATKLAEEYAKFMEAANKFGSITNPLELIDQQTSGESEEKGENFPFIYFKNSKGASTELSQREARLKALKGALLQ